MTTQAITIACRDGYEGPLTIQATATAEPNLWIHRGIDEPGWTVTHEPTGMVVARNIRSRTLALQFVVEIVPLEIDWHEVRKPADVPTGKRRAFKCIRKRYEP